MVTGKKRIVSFLLSFIFAMSVFFSSFPNAGAVAVVDDLSIAMLAFSVASGFSYEVTGLSGKECGDWLANDALPTYLKQNGFQSKDEWWGNAKAESYPLTGKVVFGKMAVQLLSDFFSWITGEYEVTPGGDSVVIYSNEIMTIGGQAVKPLVTRILYPQSTSFNLGENFDYSTITTFPLGTDIQLGNVTVRIDFSGGDYRFVINGETLLLYGSGSSSDSRVCFTRYGENFTFGVVRKVSYSSGSSEYSVDFLSKDLTDEYLLGIPVINTQGDLSISAADTLTVPDASAMTEDDVYTIAANVTAETQEDYYQKVLDAIAANSFSATAVTDVPDVPVEGDTTILGVVSNIWEGVKSIPQTLIDVGATIVSGVGTAVQGIQDAVLDIPIAIGQAVTGIKQAIVDFFTPSESLTVDGLSSVFPFCVPSDLVALVQALNHRSEAPVFVIPLNFSFVNYEDELVIDLTDWEPAAAAVRWGVTILFIGGLILLTRNLIKG